MSEAIKRFREALRDKIEKLRASLPELLRIPEYCRVTGRSPASAYNDLHNKPGLGIKVDGRTFILRDAMLAAMEDLPLWLPQKDRSPKARATASKKSTRHRTDKQTAAPRRERDPEVRP